MLRCACNRGRLTPDRRGATALEFALVGSAFVMLLLGAADLARYWFSVQALHHAVAEASRLALVDASVTGCNPARLAGVTQHPGLRGSTLRLCITRGMAGGIGSLTVTASAPFRFAYAGFGARDLTLNETATLRF